MLMAALKRDEFLFFSSNGEKKKKWTFLKFRVVDDDAEEKKGNQENINFNSSAACLHSSWIGVHKKHVFSLMWLQTLIQEPVLIEIQFWCDYIKVLLLMYPTFPFDLSFLFWFSLFSTFFGKINGFLFSRLFERTKQKTSGAIDPSGWLKKERVGRMRVIDFKELSNSVAS